MRCHYCDRDAAIAVEKGGVRVGVCQAHFRERMGELAEADLLDIDAGVDVDPGE